MSYTRELETAARELIDSISFDDNGALVGGKWMGGHGGLLSEDTRRKADIVRRILSRRPTGAGE